MTKNNIGAVLSAIECILPQTLRSSTVQLCIPIFDANNQPIRQYFEKVYNFIEEQRMTTNVVVHCAAGISRSVALLISYIMKKHGYGFNTSFKMIKSIRINASPNNGFQNQLKAYEKEL
jgi:protein-tyrosine phosphatase